MTGALVVALTVAAPNLGLAQMRSPFDPLDACKRLAAAAAVDPAGVAPAERAARRAQKERLDSLITYTEKVHQVMAAGQWTSTDFFNYLQVMRDLVDVGTSLAVLPEEALCWQRVGLTLSFDQYRLVQGRVQAGVDPPQQLNQARAQFELFRAQYQQALLRCFPAPK
jgi:hypothetical protein